jgi:hypothetical protein
MAWIGTEAERAYFRAYREANKEKDQKLGWLK